MSIIIYKKIPTKQIRKEAKKAIQDIENWFKKNPRRRVCNTETWYRKMIKVRKKHVVEDINAAADAAIKG